SFSMGLRGRQDDSALDDAIARILDAARRHGKIAGRPAFPREKIRDYIGQGFSFFQGDTDLGMMASGARAWLDALR
ncbi:MAG: aldolase/citrate lyase family protein, partial [Bryobacteraceae bacterium]